MRKSAHRNWRQDAKNSDARTRSGQQSSGADFVTEKSAPAAYGSVKAEFLFLYVFLAAAEVRRRALALLAAADDLLKHRLKAIQRVLRGE